MCDSCPRQRCSLKTQSICLQHWLTTLTITLCCTGWNRKQTVKQEGEYKPTLPQVELTGYNRAFILSSFIKCTLSDQRKEQPATAEEVVHAVTTPLAQFALHFQLICEFQGLWHFQRNTICNSSKTLLFREAALARWMWGTSCASGHNKLSTVWHLTSQYNCGIQQSISEHTIWCSRVCIRYNNRRVCGVALQSMVNCPRHLQWDKKHQLETVDEWKKVVWSDKSLCQVQCTMCVDLQWGVNNMRWWTHRAIQVKRRGVKCTQLPYTLFIPVGQCNNIIIYFKVIAVHTVHSWPSLQLVLR